MNLGVGIIRLQNVMTAMTVVALGGIGIAQGADLTMVGGFIGSKIGLVAAAALGRNSHLERVTRGVANCMGTVAIGANG